MMHSMRGWISAIGCTAALLGCRVGGGPTDGETGDDTSDGSTGTDTGGPGVDSSSGHSDTGTSSGSDAGTDGTTPEGDASANVTDAHGDAPHSDGGTDGQVLGPPDGSSGACTPTFTPTTCDPVCNTGCTGLSRCDVSDTANTGSCIGVWIQGEGSACLPKTATTDPCGPNLTCVNSVCVRLCWHNSDCTTAGTCCNTTVPTSTGTSGFKSCSTCP